MSKPLEGKTLLKRTNLQFRLFANHDFWRSCLEEQEKLCFWSVLNACFAIVCSFCLGSDALGQGTFDSDERFVSASVSQLMIPPASVAGASETPCYPMAQVDPVATSAITQQVSCCPNSVCDSSRIPLFPYWNNGFWVTSKEAQFNLHFGGNLQWDTVWLNGSDNVLGAPSSNATSTTNSGASLLRRARFKFDGNIYEKFDYSLEYDMANAVNENSGQQAPTQNNVVDSAFPCNVWMQLRDVPLFGRLRIGNQVVPLGMTNNTYQGFLPFMERADNMDSFYGAFSEGFNPGIAAINWTESERIAWRYGLYRPLKNSFGIGINNYTVSGRVTTLPVYEDDGARLIHIGLSGSQGSLVNDDFRLRAKPALRNGPGYALPVLVDTGTLPGDSQFMIGPELAAVFGRWTFQTEWTGQFISDAFTANGQSQGTAFFHGGYAQMLFFMTGEHQAYEKREGVFGRVVPHHSVRVGRGAGIGGAWQVGARVSFLDLTDKAIDGGQIVDMTLGLNWFLNPNMKIQGNYLLANRQGQQGQGDGWFNGIGVRAACDF